MIRLMFDIYAWCTHKSAQAKDHFKSISLRKRSTQSSQLESRSEFEL